MSIKFYTLVMLLFITFPIKSADYFSSFKKNEQVQFNNKKALKCFDLLDQDLLMSAEKKGLLLNHKIKTLCDQERRNKAQDLALGFAEEIQRSTTLLAFRICDGFVRETSTTLHQLIKRFHLSGLRFIHICDNTQEVRNE